jgi:hypothetical protein
MTPDRLIVTEEVERTIVLVRGHRVLLDDTLAALYGVPVKALNQAARRNVERFPSDFMLQLTLQEAQRSRSQFVTLNEINRRNYSDGARPYPAPRRRGANIKYLPLAFTEQGIAMLSTVLRTPRAVQVNIEIMRAFVRLRQLLSGHEALASKVAELEAKYDGQFKVVFDAIRELMSDAPTSDRPIGFREP